MASRVRSSPDELGETDLHHDARLRVAQRSDEDVLGVDALVLARRCRGLRDLLVDVTAGALRCRDALREEDALDELRMKHERLAEERARAEEADELAHDLAIVGHRTRVDARGRERV